MFSPLPEPNPKVVDRVSRDIAVLLLRRFANRQVTNDEFVDQMPITHDPAIGAVWSTAWIYYSDMREHKLDGIHKLHPDAKRAWIRWMLFLDSDLPYEWPDINQPGNNPTNADVSGLVQFVRRMLGGKITASKADVFHNSGYYPVWPFISKKDYKNALFNPRRLAGKLN